jgi:hypothetical protein
MMLHITSKTAAKFFRVMVSVSTLVKQHSAVELEVDNLHGSRMFLDVNLFTQVKNHSAVDIVGKDSC